MYLYLGQDTVVRMRDIIGIFDLENTSTAKITKSYLAMAQRAGHIIEVNAELPKSFIVCAGGTSREVSVYLSQISPATLLKRARESLDERGH